MYTSYTNIFHYEMFILRFLRSKKVIFSIYRVKNECQNGLFLYEMCFSTQSGVIFVYEMSIFSMKMFILRFARSKIHHTWRIFITCCVFHHEMGYSVCVECYEWSIFSMRGIHFSIKWGSFHCKWGCFVWNVHFSSQSGVEKGVCVFKKVIFSPHVVNFHHLLCISSWNGGTLYGVCMCLSVEMVIFQHLLC